MLAFHQRFAAQARRNPNGIALSGAGNVLTYGELDHRANGLAQWLRGQGVGPDSIVGLCLDWAPDVLISLLAVAKAGAAYLPLDPLLPPGRLSILLDRAQPSLILTSLVWRDRLVDRRSVTHSLEDLSPELQAVDAQSINEPVDAQQLFYVMFTSGSTGTPKGVMVTHGNVAGLFDYFSDEFLFSDQDAWTWCHSFGFGFSVWEIWGALVHGGRLVAIPPSTRADPKALRALLKQEAVTVISQTPSAFRQNFLGDEFASFAGLALRLVVLSGEAVPKADVDRWFARHVGAAPTLINTYAITETAGQVSFRRYTASESADIADNSVGCPLPGVRVLLVDSGGEPVPSGRAGELLVGGPNIALGYIGDADLTAKRFVTRDGQRWYRSGDCFRQAKNGQLEFLGRQDGQIKWRGYRIETAEVEAALQSHPRVREAAVSLRQDSSGQEKLAAYWVRARDEHAAEFWPAVGPYQIYDEFLYDLMSAEPQRLEIYRQGFAAAVAGKLVLDIGTGEHALLARLCVAAGAKHVYAIEVLPEVAERAKQLLVDLGLSESITVISGDVADLPARAKVQVATQGIIGNIGSADGIISIWNAARDWFAEDCVAVPACCRTLIAPVELPNSLVDAPAFDALAYDYAQRVFAAADGPFDIRLCLRNFPADGLLSEPAIFEDLDFSAALVENESGKADFKLNRAGRLDGFLLWTVVTGVADRQVNYLDQQQAWLPVFFPLPDGGVPVNADDLVAAQWSRQVTESICPDYDISAQIAGQNLHYSSRIKETAYQATEIHRRLWAASPRADQLTVDVLRSWLADKLPEYMLPQVWLELDRLPLTNNGKLDRAALPAPSQNRPELTTDMIAPRDNLERDLAQLWAEVLDLDQVGVADNFFDLGGDSVRAVRLASSLQRLLDKPISLAAILDAPTVAGLAAVLRAQPAMASFEQGEL